MTDGGCNWLFWKLLLSNQIVFDQLEGSNQNLEFFFVSLKGMVSSCLTLFYVWTFSDLQQWNPQLVYVGAQSREPYSTIVNYIDYKNLLLKHQQSKTTASNWEAKKQLQNLTRTAQDTCFDSLEEPRGQPKS